MSHPGSATQTNPSSWSIAIPQGLNCVDVDADCSDWTRCVDRGISGPRAGTTYGVGVGVVARCKKPSAFSELKNIPTPHKSSSNIPIAILYFVFNTLSPEFFCCPYPHRCSLHRLEED